MIIDTTLTVMEQKVEEAKIYDENSIKTKLDEVYIKDFNYHKFNQFYDNSGYCSSMSVCNSSISVCSGGQVTVVVEGNLSNSTTFSFSETFSNPKTFSNFTMSVDSPEFISF